jgi:anti-anti-sigma regulatory factor
MQQKNEPKLSWDYYHRIYRLAVKNIDAQSIAATLHLPLRTVNNILERFNEAKKQSEATENETTPTASGEAHQHEHKKHGADSHSFLDIYILSKARYAIVDLSGMLTQQHFDRLQKELSQLRSSSWKAVAILMADVVAVDEKCFNEIVRFHDDFRNRGRFAALLDPSRAIEQFIDKHKIDEKVPIFGTEKVFEEKAFALARTEGKKTIK